MKKKKETSVDIVPFKKKKRKKKDNNKQKKRMDLDLLPHIKNNKAAFLEHGFLCLNKEMLKKKRNKITARRDRYLDKAGLSFLPVQPPASFALSLS
ncbi:unnamed protein product [Boreogadus saida]